MSKQSIVIKLNQQQILSILSEHFNEQFSETSCILLGECNNDLRLVCLASNHEDLSIFSLDKKEIEKNYSYTDEKGVQLKNSKI